MRTWEGSSIHLSWPTIIAEEHRRHPGMAPSDLYKLVAQACLGGNHLLRDRESFRVAFLEEWDRTDPSGALRSDPVQVIHPAGSVARLHLHACRSLGVSEAALLEILLEQPLREGRPEALAWAWASVLHSARREEIPFDARSLSCVEAAVGVPHHSTTYGAASYRIINNLRHPSTRQALARLGLLA